MLIPDWDLLMKKKQQMEQGLSLAWFFESQPMAIWEKQKQRVSSEHTCSFQGFHSIQENQGPCGVDISVDDIANGAINTGGRCHENLSVVLILITNYDRTSTSIAFNSRLHTTSPHSTHHYLSLHLLSVQRIRETVPLLTSTNKQCLGLNYSHS